MNKIIRFAIAMLAYVAFSALPSAAQAPAVTTIEDTVYTSGGELFSGTLVISWGPFLSADSKPIFGGTKTTTVTSGALAVELAPNAGATPAGTSYRVRYSQTGTLVGDEYWVVPTSSPLATPGAPTVTPQGTPGSTTYCYWITALNATGETRLSTGTCITNGNASLNGTDYNEVDWGDVSGATSYRVFRTNSATAPAGSCPGGAHPACGVAGSPAVSTLDDQSSTSSAGVVPTVNDTAPVVLSTVRVLALPSPSVIIAPAQVSGTALVQSPGATQTATAPLTTGVPLALKGRSGNSDNVFEIYDNAGTPLLQLYAEPDGDMVSKRSVLPFASGGDLGSSGARWDLFSASLNTDLFGSSTNCSDSAGDAACSDAPAGSFVIDASDTDTVVSTTVVTANSQIVVVEDSSLGTRLSVTCNTTLGRTYAVTARTAATSFTITSSAAPTTNPACLSYWIIN
jgi:hypothetical protein